MARGSRILVVDDLETALRLMATKEDGIIRPLILFEQ